MSDNDQTEKLIQAFTDDYFEKLYYFCLKKVSNDNEAEDLTADIAMNIIQELRKGIQPNNFSAWVWKIAKNKYSAWADKKHKRLDTFSGDDINNLEIPDTFILDDNLIHQENIKLLRRELAFISSEYRNVVVAYYIEYHTIKDIAASLHLPIGTVKSKLSRSRNILKEGMNMAREFGVKSYKPEHISFIKSGTDGKDGSPWSKLETKLAKNILLQAHKNPSTIEELSLEMGVAAPYMEEAVDELIKATLMKKSGNKYETDFNIINADEQRETENAHLKIKDEYFQISKDILEIIEKEGNKNLLGGTQTFEELKWIYLLDLADGINCHVERPRPADESVNVYSGYTKRPHGGEWDITGYEDFKSCEDNVFIGYNGSGSTSSKINVCAYDFHQYSWGQRSTNWSFRPEHIKIIEKILDNQFDEDDKKVVQEVMELGAFELIDGKYICKMAIAKRNEDLFSQNLNENVYKNKFMPLYDKLKTLEKSAGKNIWMRPYVFSSALRAGYLTIPENFNRSMIGICVKK